MKTTWNATAEGIQYLISLNSDKAVFEFSSRPVNELAGVGFCQELYSVDKNTKDQIESIFGYDIADEIMAAVNTYFAMSSADRKDEKKVRNYCRDDYSRELERLHRLRNPNEEPLFLDSYSYGNDGEYYLTVLVYPDRVRYEILLDEQYGGTKEIEEQVIEDFLENGPSGIGKQCKEIVINKIRSRSSEYFKKKNYI